MGCRYVCVRVCESMCVCVWEGKGRREGDESEGEEEDVGCRPAYSGAHT